MFNGDIGYITAVDTVERTISVIYDGRVVAYDVTELDEITLAYAIHNQTVSTRNTKLKERLNNK